MWTSCLNINDRNQGGRPEISLLKVKQINDHLEKNSTVAANRFLKKLKVCANYRHLSLRESYQTMRNKEDVSYSTFYKKIQKKYKKPHRLSDLCRYCEVNKVC